MELRLSLAAVALVCALSAGRVAVASGKATYVVTAERLNSNVPLFNSQDGQSSFKYNYNTAYLPLRSTAGSGDSGVVDALLVRCQNILANATSPYDVTPSVLALTTATGAVNTTFDFANISANSVVFAPEGPADHEGTEDPRVVLFDGVYYLLYTAVNHNDTTGGANAHLALATTATPANASSWVRHGYLFPGLSWSKSGALLARGLNQTNFLFWGDSSLVKGLQVATSTDLLSYSYNATIWLPIRPHAFDSVLVEAGPMPLPLTDGNYLFLYNSARGGYPSPKPGYDLQYNIGWVILDGDNPSIIVARSDEPLLSPTEPWEIGTAPYLGLTPNVVFVEGWKAVGPNMFDIFYGAADSVVGTARVTVQIA